MEIAGKNFKISSYSGGSNCVGVSITDTKISVINTKKQKTTIDFTYQEWEAFVQGVKAGEFDLPEQA